MLFLQVLEKALSDGNAVCHADCLMTNHYHLLAETPDANLSRIMKQINGIYTQRFNRRHDRPGHVFQRRFQSILVEKDVHLLALCRYIVCNPVRAGMVEDPAAYRWTGFRPTAGMGKIPGRLSTGWILRQFGEKRSRAQAEHRRFVKSAMKEASPWKALKGQCLLGGADFIESLSTLLKQTSELLEIPKAVRMLHRPDLASPFPTPERVDKIRRNQAIREAYHEHGYSQKEISDYLGLHPTTVSKVIRKNPETKNLTPFSALSIGSPGKR
jgi:REP element-mobilizing transposase RayT